MKPEMVDGFLIPSEVKLCINLLMNEGGKRDREKRTEILANSYKKDAKIQNKT